MCSLHANKYGERVKDLICNNEICFGRGFTCIYGALEFRFCHLHMASALETEVEIRHKLNNQTQDQTQDRNKPEPRELTNDDDNEFDFDELWTPSAKDCLRKPTELLQDDTMPPLMTGMKRRHSVGSVESNQQVQKREDAPTFGADRGPKSMEGIVHHDISRGNQESTAERRRSGRSDTKRPGDTDSVFANFAKSGLEENGSRAAEIEGMMPNFARRPREKPTFIPVEMQAEYESHRGKKGPWEIVSDGFGEMRQTAEEKDTKQSSRVTEFTIFALRGFGCFRVELGVGAYGKELSETLKRQASVMKETMYRKGIRVPLTNRIIQGASEALWGSEVHGASPGNQLLVSDFAPWGLNSFEDYVRKDEKIEPR